MRVLFYDMIHNLTHGGQHILIGMMIKAAYHAIPHHKCRGKFYCFVFLDGNILIIKLRFKIVEITDNSLEAFSDLTALSPICLFTEIRGVSVLFTLIQITVGGNQLTDSLCDIVPVEFDLSIAFSEPDTF